MTMRIRVPIFQDIEGNVSQRFLEALRPGLVQCLRSWRARARGLGLRVRAFHPRVELGKRGQNLPMVNWDRPSKGSGGEFGFR